LTVLQAIILGVVQGFTEFLPVSSSGHLVLAQKLLNVQSANTLTFDVFVHFGTLISVFVFFWKDIVEILKSIVSSLKSMSFKEEYSRNEHFRIGVSIVAGSIPAGVIGLLFRDIIKDTFTDPKLAAVCLVVTGLILFLTRLARPNPDKKIGVVSALVIGVAQAVAILPGISRSGSTISTGMYLKLSSVRAAQFSFLLSIPVIAGASLLETKNLIAEGVDIGAAPLIVGTLVSAVTGYISIKAMLKILQRGKLSWFAFYCLVVGVLGIIFI